MSAVAASCSNGQHLSVPNHHPGAPQQLLPGISLSLCRPHICGNCLYLRLTYLLAGRRAADSRSRAHHQGQAWALSRALCCCPRPHRHAAGVHGLISMGCTSRRRQYGLKWAPSAPPAVRRWALRLHVCAGPAPCLLRTCASALVLQQHVHLPSQFLLRKGADLDAEDPNARLPLHHAAASGKGVEALRYLIQHATWLNAQDGADDTPLHLAARYAWHAAVPGGRMLTHCCPLQAPSQASASW